MYYLMGDGDHLLLTFIKDIIMWMGKNGIKVHRNHGRKSELL